MKKITGVLVAVGLLALVPSALGKTVRPDQTVVLSCQAAKYDAHDIEVTSRIEGRKEWLTYSQIRHPHGEGTVVTYTRQSGRGASLRVYSSPEGRRLVATNIGKRQVRFIDPCPPRSR